MARPLPDPAMVIAVFEAKHYDGLNYSQLVEWTNGHDVEGLERWRWDPISRGCAFAWYKQGLEWWIAHERLNPQERAASLEIGLEWLAGEGVREYKAGRLDYKVMADTLVKISAEFRALTGAGRGSEDVGEIVAPPPRAQAAIEEMKTRRDELEARRTRGRGKVIG